MASYHCTVKVGGKGKAGPHADYIAREGKYEKSAGRYEDLEAKGHGNMPKWAEHQPSKFWQAADEHERANGATYREIEVALPRELNRDQRLALVKDFIEREFGDRHAFTFAIHNPKAALEKGEQPGAHIMYSERTRDGIERDPDQYFKRYNSKNPEKGGCKKDSAGTEERLQATRQRWAEIQNEHLARHGHIARVDHRSLKDQGIQREPEKHIGAKRIQSRDFDVSVILERRAAEGELERSQRIVSFIDVSGDLSAARADRDRKAMDDFKAAARAASAAKAEREAAAAKALALVRSRFQPPTPTPTPAPRTDHEIFVERNRARTQQGIDASRAAGRTAPATPAAAPAVSLADGMAQFRAQFDGAKIAAAAAAAKALADKETAQREAKLAKLQQANDRAKAQRLSRGTDQDYPKPKGMSR